MKGRKDKDKPANRLWQARKRRGVGQKQIAFLINKTVDEISRYERGVRLPELATALALEIVYGIPLRLLFKELYEQLQDDIRQRVESQEALKNVYEELLSSKGDNSLREFCAYEDLLRLPNLSQEDKAKIHDHITHLARKYAYL
jgi:transcriptional regulator with XRE-family HTH domain